MKKATVELAGAVLPDQFFRKDGPEVRNPKGPWWALLTAYACEICTLLALAGFFIFFFATQFTPTTVISPAIQPKPAACLALAPKVGTAYFSKTTSENAQFAKNSQTSADCTAMLSQAQVCSDAHRLDVISVLGVANPASPQYYPPTSTGSQGYFSFTPSQTAGVTTEMTTIYGTTGVSVSFPKPAAPSQVFTGTAYNWNVFNFAENTAADAFTPYPAVFAAGLLYDAKAAAVYDPDPTTQQQDYDLSGAAIDSSAADIVGTLAAATGQYLVSDLGVYDGVYYGLRTGAAFDGPAGVAVDAAGNVYVADSGNNLVRKIAASDGAVTSLGTSANPAFSGPRGICIDSAGNVYVADTDNDLVRRIDATTQAVTSLGTSAIRAFKEPRGVAVDADGNVYVADSGNDLVRRIAALDGAVTDLGTSAILAFKGPYGVAVDALGNVFVADRGNDLVRKIAASDGAVTSLGTSASPPFIGPVGVAVDTSGTVVYVADTNNNLVRKIIIDLVEVSTTLGISASPAFRGPYGVAVDGDGNLFVGDSGNNLVRRIDAQTQAVTRLGQLSQARVFSWDTRSPSPLSYTLWPDAALSSNSAVNSGITVVDSAAGGCQSLAGDASGWCYLLTHAEYNAEAGRIYLEFQQYQLGIFAGGNYLSILDPSPARLPIPNMYTYSSYAVRNLWAVFNTPANGTVLFTSQGGAYSDRDVLGVSVMLPGLRYNALVTAAGTSILGASKIPAVAGSQPQFLVLLLLTNGFRSMVTYDAFTDTVVVSNAAAAAATNYMLAYTWGICDSNVTRSLVEITFSNDFSNVCQTPSTGLYYQSPNVYYAIPYACLGIAYDKLLTDCPEIRANMKTLVDATCIQSIAKVCRQQYELNPPFSCVTNVYPTALTVISLAASNTMALYGVASLLFALLLRRVYGTKYRATPSEARGLSPKADTDTLLKNFLLSCCGCKTAEEREAAEGKERDTGAIQESDECAGVGEGDIQIPGSRGRPAEGAGPGRGRSGSDSSSEASWTALPRSPPAPSIAGAVESYLDNIMCGLGGSARRGRGGSIESSDGTYSSELQPPLDLETAQASAAMREQFARLRALEDRLQRQSFALEARQFEVQRLQSKNSALEGRFGEMERLLAASGGGVGGVGSVGGVGGMPGSAGRRGPSGRRI